jgi:hypothetical protein
MATVTNANAHEVWDMTAGGGNNGAGDYVACPPGNHPGTIVGLFDVGTREETSVKYGTKKVHRLIMVFELVKKRPDGQPFVLARKYTRSLNPKSDLYKDICNLLGSKLKDGEHFNPAKLIGFPVLISVSNTQSGEKTYHDVTSYAQYPEGFPPIAPTYPTVVWSVLTGEPFPQGHDWLPFIFGKSIKELAESSDEHRARFGLDVPDFDPPPPRQGPGPANAPLDPPAARGADDIPF